jgi:transcriptional regulator GlxA family with amidase domain
VSVSQGLTCRHLANTVDAVTVIETALELVAAMKHSPGTVTFLRAALIDQLCFWRQSQDPHTTELNCASLERLRLISLAREWIHSRLDQPFHIEELAEALHVSSRNLQYCFCQELGHSPLIETRKIRFRRLRELLLSTPAGQVRIEILFQRCGLPYSPIIRHHYHNWCGESPQQTQFRAATKS